jgi:dienelactone hydrolase
MLMMTLLILLIIAADPPEALAPANPHEQHIALAQVLVNQLLAGEFEKAVEPFDGTMKAGLPAAALKQVWAGTVTQFGEFKQAAAVRAEKVDKYVVVFITMEFAQGKLDCKVVFDRESRVTGLFFVPSGKYQPPKYARPDSFTEQEVQIGRGFFPLPGTLALPKGDGPFPAVILVHGSGPNDRDETIGPNKPFRDLAHGLASRGIAVLRYEKRTKQYPVITSLLSGGLTVQEETVNDAAAAVDTLVARDKIDRQRIFVLGHSLGGYVLPRIALATDKPAGFISLAGSTRPMEDLILEQTKYILSLDGKVTDDEEKQLATIAAQVERVKSKELKYLTLASELPLGVPASYWLDLRDYDPAAEAKKIKQPLLILQGERDYQVTLADFARWKEALSSREDVKLVTYPRLNHLFMQGKERSSPVEYFKPGNVDEIVVADIAAWIQASGK